MKKILQHITLFLLILIGVQAFGQDNSKMLYSFGGHAKVDQFPITYCDAQLFSVDNPTIPIAQVKFDTLGYYFFYKIPEGKYFVKAGPGVDDPYFSYYSFTYYPNHIDPLLADTIYLFEDNWDYDIDLTILESQNTFTGTGNITGFITYDELKEFDLSKVNILLLDSEMKPLSHLQANNDGTFSFNELTNGDYILFPRIDGYQTQAIQISIDNHNNNIEGLNISIKNGQISSYINEAIVLENSFLCFPNPASHNLNLSFDFDGAQQIQTRVLDITGRTILEIQDNSVNQFNHQFNTSDWDNGYYFVEVFMNGKKAIIQKVAVLH